MTPPTTYDIAVVGGGIVGLATAERLLRDTPDASVVVIEKEQTLAAHQTGRNSGVIHSGIYYKPGSLKAKNCREGKLALQAFCDEEGVPYELCGKVIVAVDADEVPRLERILQRGQQNGVECRMIDADELRTIEPHAAGVQAIAVPESGIVDYSAVCQKLGERIERAGGVLHLGARVTDIRVGPSDVTVRTTSGDVTCDHLVNCAGLFSDRITKLTGSEVPARIVPFRGEYYELKPEAAHLCRHLIYPVPDPEFPFLGVHFTRMIGGGIECGPNAVLAFAREGYRKRDVSLRDLADSLTYPGFLRLAAKHWKMGAGEMWRSVNKSAFVKALQRLMPEIRKEHLVKAPSGVRAQALLKDGNLVDDFLIVQADRVTNVCNAPSPAATASLSIAEEVVRKVTGRSSMPTGRIT